MKTFNNHPLWRGGKIKRHQKYNWQVRRRAVLTRDKFTCQDCGYIGKLHKRGRTERRLVAHHIKGFRYERWDKDSVKKLITLCDSCHPNAEQKLLRKHSKFPFYQGKKESARKLSLRGFFGDVFRLFRG